MYSLPSSSYPALSTLTKLKPHTIKILPKMPRMGFEPTPYEWRAHRCIDHSATAWIGYMQVCSTETSISMPTSPAFSITLFTESRAPFHISLQLIASFLTTRFAIELRLILIIVRLVIATLCVKRGPRCDGSTAGKRTIWNLETVFASPVEFQFGETGYKQRMEICLGISIKPLATCCRIFHHEW